MNPALVPHAVALTIAGSDPSGGAGLQADLKTFQQLRVYGMSVVSLITVQNTQAVSQVHVLTPKLVVAQLNAVLDDIPPTAIKTGALGNAQIVQAVGERLAATSCPLVVDPVLVSKHGNALVTEDVVDAYKEFLLPHALLVTPNRFEAERLTGFKLTDQDSVAKVIYQLEQLGAKHILLKLGEVDGQSHHVLSLKNHDCGMVVPRLRGNNTHGSGCILSAAITARLALGQVGIEEAVQFGIERTLEAIQCNSRLGKGVHPAEVRAITW